MSPVPDGYGLLDASECGVALLRAGAKFKSEAWTAGGLRAVEWARKTTSSAFHGNAAAVSLFVAAYQATADKQHLTAAWDRYSVGIAPGQTADGRWVEPTDARTPNHLLILRALLDLEESLSFGKNGMRSPWSRCERSGPSATTSSSWACRGRRTPFRNYRASSAAPGIGARFETGWRSPRRPRSTAASGERVRLGAPLPELAAVGKVWEK